MEWDRTLGFSIDPHLQPYHVAELFRLHERVRVQHERIIFAIQLIRHDPKVNKGPTLGSAEC